MGSITHVVEKDQVRNHYAYDVWGNATTCEEIVENRFRFNGQQYDPITQQYYLRARFYNPVIGRFTQEDTYRGDGLNLYAYCSNSPLLYRDLNGLEKEIVWGTDDKGRTTYTDSTGKYTKDGMGRWHAKNGKIVHDPTKSSQSKNIKPQNQITGDTVADRYKRIRAANPNISASEALELARNGVDGQVSINLPPVDNDNHHGTRKRENGQYHVFYTHHLDPTKRFSSDSVQFRDANKALQKELQENYAFRKKMFTRYPGLIEWSKRGDMGVRLKEAGLVWHHDPNSFRDNGTFDLQLCDWNDHNSNPNIYNDENGHGGRNNWGGGIPGRDGKLDVNGNLIQ
ncbi:tRNA nuclease WapA [Lachnospiraceae bacterium]|nr:tRNA nuclease WapA [Lachnospiraceae bacterium]